MLGVLQNKVDAPKDLRRRALQLAAGILEMGRKAQPGAGLALAQATLDSGAAWNKFQAICEAQGGFTEPGEAPFQARVLASRTGRIDAIDNRRLAKVAKLSGAPRAALAGIDCSLRIGDPVVAGQPLYTVHAQSPGERDYVLAYAQTHTDILSLETP